MPSAATGGHPPEGVDSLPLLVARTNPADRVRAAGPTLEYLLALLDPAFQPPAGREPTLGPLARHHAERFHAPKSVLDAVQIRNRLTHPHLFAHLPSPSLPVIAQAGETLIQAIRDVLPAVSRIEPELGGWIDGQTGAIRASARILSCGHRSDAERRLTTFAFTFGIGGMKGAPVWMCAVIQHPSGVRRARASYTPDAWQVYGAGYELDVLWDRLPAEPGQRTEFPYRFEIVDQGPGSACLAQCPGGVFAVTWPVSAQIVSVTPRHNVRGDDGAGLQVTVETLISGMRGARGAVWLRFFKCDPLVPLQPFLPSKYVDAGGNVSVWRDFETAAPDVHLTSRLFIPYRGVQPHMSFDDFCYLVSVLQYAEPNGQGEKELARSPLRRCWINTQTDVSEGGDRG